MRPLQAWSITAATFVLIAPCALALDCEDRDADGYFSIAGCGTERDVNDDDALAYPGAPERCNGRDDDGDRLVDEEAGCRRTCAEPELVGPPLRLGESSGDGDVVFRGDGWIVAWVEVDADSGCDAVKVAELGLSGEVVAGPVTVSGGPGEPLDAEEPRLAWTGDAIGVAWAEQAYADPASCGTFPAFPLAFFQPLTPSFEPAAERVALEPCDGGAWTRRARVGWSGATFALTWREYVGEEDERARFTTIDRDGAGDRCGTLIAGAESAPRTGPAWNGRHFATAWAQCPPPSEGRCRVDVEDEIFASRLGEDGSIVGPTTRVTEDPAQSLWEVVVATDAGWTVLWQDDRQSPTFPELYSSRLDDEGREIEPEDRRFTFGNDDEDDESRENPDAAWSGAEFAVVYEEWRGPLGFGNVGRFERMGRDGQSLGPGVTIGDGSSVAARFPRVARGADEYGLVYATEGAVHFARVGCHCTDSDSDGFTTCQGQDCNDNDASINPFAAEACLSGSDDDCDGLTDCQDTAACPPGDGTPPGPVTGVAFAEGTETLLWQERADATSYDVLTGDVGTLRLMASFAGARCAAWRVPETSWETLERPAPGDALWYLVRGKADTCLLGTWGSPLRDEARLVCP